MQSYYYVSITSQNRVVHELAVRCRMRHDRGASCDDLDVLG